MIRPAIAGIAFASMAAATHAQDEAPVQPDFWETELAAELPEPEDYFCGVVGLNEYQDGSPFIDFDRASDLGRPKRTSIPRSDEDGIVSEAMNAAGNAYAYVKIEGEGLATYAIHGVFYFDENRLTTTRSRLFPADDGTWLAWSSSFEWLCEPVEQAVAPGMAEEPSAED